MWNFKLLRHCATVPNLFITIATIIFTATMIYSQKFVFRGTRGTFILQIILMPLLPDDRRSWDPHTSDVCSHD